MGTFIDLTGQKYGKLTVIERAENINGRVAWKCRCDCGKEITTTSNALRTGNTKSCGCSRYEPKKEELLTLSYDDEIPVGRAKDLRGQKFNKLTVLYRVEKPNNIKQKQAYWKCQCECGNITIVSAANLTSGSTKSCGCWKKERFAIEHDPSLREDELPIGNAINLTGQRFGQLTVLYRAKIPEHVINRGVYWKCQCDCGKITIVNGNALRCGKTTSCGNHKFNDLTNQRFGRLVALKHVGANKKGYALWECKCDCGNIKTITSEDLLSGRTNSCGCLKRELFRERSKTISPGEKFGKLIVIEEAYIKNHKRYWKCQCECGSIIYVPSGALTTGNTQSCGCLNSKGELKIMQLLTKYNINYLKEYTFDDLVSPLRGRKLRFDFFINNQYLIEYDGRQHFEVAPNWGGEEKFKENQLNDKVKNEYCKIHNIPLIRIPYWHYNKITIDDLRPETSQFLI